MGNYRPKGREVKKNGETSKKAAGGESISPAVRSPGCRPAAMADIEPLFGALNSNAIKALPDMERWPLDQSGLAS